MQEVHHLRDLGAVCKFGGGGGGGNLYLLVLGNKFIDTMVNRRVINIVRT